MLVNMQIRGPILTMKRSVGVTPEANLRKPLQASKKTTQARGSPPLL